jgi:hypothetical protein
MKSSVLSLAAAAACLAATAAHAQVNLLNDPGFEAATTATQTSNSNWTLNANFPDGVGSAAQFQFAPWASNPLGVAGTGVWFKAFEGNQAPEGIDPPAEATLSQTVAAGPGLYDLSFFVRRETNFTASAMTVVLSSDVGDSATFDILASAPNDGAYNQMAINNFMAGPGATSLTVVATMDDGVVGPANPQSLMLDDFNLSLIPEPATAGLAVTALALAALTRRRR